MLSRTKSWPPDCIVLHYKQTHRITICLLEYQDRLDCMEWTAENGNGWVFQADTRVANLLYTWLTNVPRQKTCLHWIILPWVTDYPFIKTTPSGHVSTSARITWTLHPDTLHREFLSLWSHLGGTRYYRRALLWYLWSWQSLPVSDFHHVLYNHPTDYRRLYLAL